MDPFDLGALRAADGRLRDQLRLPEVELPRKDFRGVLEGALDASRESAAARDARRSKGLDDLPVSNRPDATPDARERYRLREAAGQLEGVFVNLMLERMRATIQKSEMFSGGRGEEVFQRLFDQKIAENASTGRGLGIGRMVYEQMVQRVGSFRPVESSPTGQ